MKILINGGCGFLGSNLASYGIINGFDITVFDNMSRIGSEKNLEWLKSIGNIKFISGDTRNKNDVETTIKNGQFDAIFHLAGQVAMTTSIENSYKDFETNVCGAINVLDSVRKYSQHTHVLFSSTNKVYGDLEYLNYIELEKRYKCVEFPNGFDERINLDFRSPYGCSKGAADQYMLDYFRTFGVRTTVFRHSSMYGSRQYATYDQGWVGWFVQKALEQKSNSLIDPFTISGDGKQVRDILNNDDMIELYYTAVKNVDAVAGKAYNIGGGMSESLSLIELFDLLNDVLGIKLNYIKLPWRLSDQKVFVADISKIKNDIGWEPKVSAKDGIVRMIDWVSKI